jgi:hypothetical protein
MELGSLLPCAQKPSYPTLSPRTLVLGQPEGASKEMVCGYEKWMKPAKNLGPGGETEHSSSTTTKIIITQYAGQTCTEITDLVRSLLNSRAY